MSSKKKFFNDDDVIIKGQSSNFEDGFLFTENDEYLRDYLDISDEEMMEGEGEEWKISELLGRYENEKKSSKACESDGGGECSCVDEIIGESNEDIGGECSYVDEIIGESNEDIGSECSYEDDENIGESDEDIDNIGEGECSYADDIGDDEGSEESVDDYLKYSDICDDRLDAERMDNYNDESMDDELYFKYESVDVICKVMVISNFYRIFIIIVIFQSSKAVKK